MELNSIRVRTYIYVYNTYKQDEKDCMLPINVSFEMKKKMEKNVCVYKIIWSRFCYFLCAEANWVSKHRLCWNWMQRCSQYNTILAFQNFYLSQRKYRKYKCSIYSIYLACARFTQTLFFEVHASFCIIFVATCEGTKQNSPYCVNVGKAEITSGLNDRYIHWNKVYWFTHFDASSHYLQKSHRT